MFRQDMGDVAIYTELGRFMMGPYGCLVTKAIHEKHTHKEYIGVDACAVNPDASGYVRRIPPHHRCGQRGCTVRSSDMIVAGSLCENNAISLPIDRYASGNRDG